jgi:hypothetical protein
MFGTVTGMPPSAPAPTTGALGPALAAAPAPHGPRPRPDRPGAHVLDGERERG